MNAGPYCIQWGIARRVEKYQGEVRIDQEHGAWEDITNTIRALHVKARDESGRHPGPMVLRPWTSRSGSLPSSSMRPLWTYEPRTKVLAPAACFMVRVRVDTSSGPVTGLVDVVALSELEAFIRRYRSAVALLGERLPKLAPALFEASVKMRSLHRNRASTEALLRHGRTDSGGVTGNPRRRLKPRRHSATPRRWATIFATIAASASAAVVVAA